MIIGFIGLGSMGAAMATRLIDAGHTLRFYARKPLVISAFKGRGAVYCESPAAVAMEAQVVCTNVTTGKDVESVLLGEQGVIHGARPGTIVCDFSTISAPLTIRMAEALAARDIDMLDCPVSGGTRGAQEGTLAIMVGGKSRVLDSVMPLLDVLGKRIVYIGGHGAGQVTKACNQIVQVITIQGIAEALTFARTQGIEVDKVVEALSAGFAGSRMLDLMGPKIANRDWSAGIESRLHHKDFGMIVEMLHELGLALPATALVAQQLNAVVGQGWGTMDTCNLARVLERTGVGQ
jgi:2-hydroxy-3-oxopropionate reductase